MKYKDFFFLGKKKEAHYLEKEKEWRFKSRAL
jgi:hypothetical protein